MKKITKRIAAVLIGIAITGCGLWIAGREPDTGQQAEQKQAQPLKIEIPERSTYGSIVIYDKGEIHYQYTGDHIKIVNDGRNGEQIEIIVYIE